MVGVRLSPIDSVGIAHNVVCADSLSTALGGVVQVGDPPRVYKLVCHDPDVAWSVVARTTHSGSHTVAGYLVATPGNPLICKRCNGMRPYPILFHGVGIAVMTSELGCITRVQEHDRINHHVFIEIKLTKVHSLLVELVQQGEHAGTQSSSQTGQSEGIVRLGVVRYSPIRYGGVQAEDTV